VIAKLRVLTVPGKQPVFAAPEPVTGQPAASRSLIAITWPATSTRTAIRPGGKPGLDAFHADGLVEDLVTASLRWRIRCLAAAAVCTGLLQPRGRRIAGDCAARIGGRRNGRCQAEGGKSSEDQILHRYLHPSSRARCPAFDGG
jgi:hypothetical protein